MDDIATRGENLRRYFKSKGLTQKDAAEWIGISAPHMANLLNGRDGMGQKKVGKIVAAFPEISEAYLLTGKGQLVPGGISINQHHNSGPVSVSGNAIQGDAALAAEVQSLREQLERERQEKARLLGIIETMTGK